MSRPELSQRLPRVASAARSFPRLQLQKPVEARLTCSASWRPATRKQITQRLVSYSSYVLLTWHLPALPHLTLKKGAFCDEELNVKKMSEQKCLLSTMQCACLTW